MEAIFNMISDEFIGTMHEAAEDAAEKYDEEETTRLLMERIEIWMLAEKVFAYVKQQGKKKWKTSALLDELSFIVRTKEVFYLEKEEDFKCARIKRYLTNYPMAIEDVCFLGFILEYYYMLHEEAQQTDQYTKNVHNAFDKLLCLKEEKEKKDQEKKKKQQDLKTLPLYIKNLLDSEMTGQEEAKKTVAMAIYRLLRFEDRTPILLAGPTGCGKTLIYQILSENPELQKLLNFFSYTASDVSPTGYQGTDPADIFKMYKMSFHSLFETGNDKKGIIFIDEIDKILTYSNTAKDGENFNAIIQHQLLSAVAGTQDYGDVKTSNILFIFAGAFENLEVEMKKEKNPMGFGTSVISHRELFCLGRSDFRAKMIEAGAVRQFIARIGQIVTMKSLSREQMRNILVDPKYGILAKRTKEFESQGRELIVEDGLVERIIDQMIQENTGARAAQAIVTDLIGTWEFEMLQRHNEIMILHEGMMSGEPPLFMDEKGVSDSEKNGMVVRMA